MQKAETIWGLLIGKLGLSHGFRAKDLKPLSTKLYTFIQHPLSTLENVR